MFAPVSKVGDHFPWSERFPFISSHLVRQEKNHPIYQLRNQICTDCVAYWFISRVKQFPNLTIQV